jgi:hypothetical protein
MSISEHPQPLDRDAEGGEGADEDPGDELEATIEQADRPFASDSFGTTAEEQREGETLDQRLAEEEPSREPLDVQVAIEDFDAPDEEKQLVGRTSLEHDPFVAPEEAAMTIRETAPGATSHPEEPEIDLPDDA